MPSEKDKIEKGDGFVENSHTTFHLIRDEAMQYTSVRDAASWMNKSKGPQEERLTWYTSL